MPIEINSEAGLSITTEGAGNRQRFAEVFGQVWQSIPAEEREEIVAHWEEGFAGQVSPQIELLAEYELPGKNDAFGNILYFNAEVAELLDDADLLPDLIAHELGHVYCFSISAPGHASFPPIVLAKEDEADAKANDWGYDMHTLRNWTNEHIEEMADCGVFIPEGGRW